jgi:hypothetical protein
MFMRWAVERATLPNSFFGRTKPAFHLSNGKIPTPGAKPIDSSTIRLPWSNAIT